MTNDKLKYELLKINLNECEEIYFDHIYYVNKEIKQRCSRGNGTYCYSKEKYEFIIVAENGIKKAIILRCGCVDLHWYVLKEWRNKHVLSNALRTGIIKQIWPENKQITCCYDYNDNYDLKYSLTKHLADLAGLELIER